tara:strand:- start:134 stop:271 length:138 start_codon:yes stop_codon:yes gene_type:complete
MTKYRIVKEPRGYVVFCPYERTPIKVSDTLKEAETFVFNIMRYCG